MIAAWLAGLVLAFGYGLVRWEFSDGWGWVWGKAAFVLLLTAYHLQLGRYLEAFAEDRNEKPAKFFRAINEIPTLLMIGIVIFVIVRPF
jgi:putative membrane protein